MLRRSRYEKRTEPIFCTRSEKWSENRSSRFEPKNLLISFSRGSGPPLILYYNMVRGRPLKNSRFVFILFVGLHVLHCGLKCAGHGCVVCCWCYCVLMPSLRSISPLAATSRKRPQRWTRAWQAPHSKHAPAKPVLNMVCSYVRSLYVILMCVCVPLVGAPQLCAI